jgi:hypothetical protein
MIGQVVSLNASGVWAGGSQAVHVKIDPAERCGIWWTIAHDTRIAQRLSNGSRRKANVSELMPGRMVRVWSRGCCQRSCPEQGTAEAIEIMAP